MGAFAGLGIPNTKTTDATVTIGEVPLDDNGAFYAPLAAEEEGLALFTDYEVNNRYEKDNHVYMMPIASPGGFQGHSVSFVQLASATLLWISDWTAARLLKQPVAPDPTVSDGNWILLDVHLEPGMVTVGPDGATPLYRISGTYVYGHVNPSRDIANNVSFSRPPWLEDVFDRSMPLDKLAKGIIDRNVGGPVRYANPGVPASEGYVVETS